LKREDDMFFGHKSNQPSEEIAKGATRRMLSTGEKIQLCWLELKGGTPVPEHAHPHEQAGYVLEGKFEAVIGEHKEILKKGSFFRIPGDVPHSGFVHEDTIMIEVYSPPR
jgi:quercetin dioxygenase-like cupin family protein